MNGMAYDDERSTALPLVRGILQPWTHNTGGFVQEMFADSWILKTDNCMLSQMEISVHEILTPPPE
jgi:hypothetical protein